MSFSVLVSDPMEKQHKTINKMTHGFFDPKEVTEEWNAKLICIHSSDASDEKLFVIKERNSKEIHDLAQSHGRAQG